MARTVPAEGHRPVPAGTARRGNGAGETGERVGGREATATVADLSEKSGGADGAGAGQVLEDERVGVESELLGDLLLETVDPATRVRSTWTRNQGDLRLCGGRDAMFGPALRPEGGQAERPSPATPVLPSCGGAKLLAQHN
jgi:hypothetical protein